MRVLRKASFALVSLWSALLLAGVTEGPVCAQQASPYRARPYNPDPSADPPAVRVKAHAQLGLGWNTAPTHAYDDVIGNVGVAFELPRLRLEPGLDLRLMNSGQDVVSRVVGPRIGHTFGPIHPYAEALFGTGHVNGYDGKGNPMQQSPGVSAFAVAGFDVRHGSLFEWRALELSYGNFTGVPHTRPFGISGGLVLRFDF